MSDLWGTSPVSRLSVAFKMAIRHIDIFSPFHLLNLKRLWKEAGGAFTFSTILNRGLERGEIEKEHGWKINDWNATSWKGNISI